MADSQKYKPLLPNNPLCGVDTYKDSLNLATGACTRAIKKIVLSGRENYGTSGNNTWLIIGNDTLDFRGTANGVYCSHVPTVLRTDLSTNTCCWGGGQIGDLIININNYSGESLKAYIADQYSAGTPVTVWYVLATPTTETITVPTGLSGTEEGYLTQTETPTPTNPIYPTANEVLIWQHSLHKLTTATEVVENPLYSDGTAITAYTIKGNTVQNGTPTPSNPVEVNGVGERTENLCDGIIEQGSIDNTGDIPSDTRIRTKNYISLPESQCVISASGDINKVLVYYYDENKNYKSNTGWLNLPYTFSISTTDKYARLIFKKYIGGVDQNVSPTDVSNVMVNSGNTAKPYEPYGYKIPISSGGVTTNIYLGSTQTVRQIKKIVFDGSENWSNQNVGQHGAVSIQKDDLPLTPDMPAGTLNVLSTHFKAISNSSQLDIGEMVAGGSYLNFDYDGTNNLTDFKAFLATQYANGTPVEVYYILETATTAAVNEPLMKIGDYADTLSNATAIPTTEGANSITVDTTVQPSEFTATWTGWHDASVKEWDGSQWG